MKFSITVWLIASIILVPAYLYITGKVTCWGDIVKDYEDNLSFLWHWLLYFGWAFVIFAYFMWWYPVPQH